jgi:hypothetical protein
LPLYASGEASRLSTGRGGFDSLRGRQRGAWSGFTRPGSPPDGTKRFRFLVFAPVRIWRGEPAVHRLRRVRFPSGALIVHRSNHGVRGAYRALVSCSLVPPWALRPEAGSAPAGSFSCGLAGSRVDACFKSEAMEASQIPNLAERVRFLPDLPRAVFSPRVSSGAVAQLGERLHGSQEAVGSNPIGSTRRSPRGAATMNRHAAGAPRGRSSMGEHPARVRKIVGSTPTDSTNQTA